MSDFYFNAGRHVDCAQFEAEERCYRRLAEGWGVLSRAVATLITTLFAMSAILYIAGAL